MKSWKTTVAGIITFLSPIAIAIWPTHAAAIAAVTSAATGAGLMAARDNGVSSEQAGVK